jgi:hypothetical protein
MGREVGADRSRLDLAWLVVWGWIGWWEGWVGESDRRGPVRGGKSFVW